MARGKVCLGHGARFTVAPGHPWGPRMGSLKSLCRTSYWSSAETIALNCIVFWQHTNKHFDRQTEGHRHHRKILLAQVQDTFTILILLSVHSCASSLARRVTSSDASAIAFAQSMRSLLEPPSPLHINNHVNSHSQNIVTAMKSWPATDECYQQPATDECYQQAATDECYQQAATDDCYQQPATDECYQQAAAVTPC